MGRLDPPLSPKSAMVAKGFFVLGLDEGPAPCQPRGRPYQRIRAVHADDRALAASATGRRKRRGRKDEEAAGEKVLDSMETLLFHSSIHYQRREEIRMRWMEVNAFTIFFRTHEGNKPESYCQFYSNSRTLAHFALRQDVQSLRVLPHPACQVEEKGLFDNQGAWCSQATNGCCLTSATQTTTMSSSLSYATTMLHFMG